jgi:hypothetical protein
MKQCIKCGEQFSTTYDDNGVITKLYDSRKCCVGCAPIGVIPGNYSEFNKQITCVVCKTHFNFIGHNGNFSHKMCAKCYRRHFRKLFKDKAIEYGGGKCKHCGYNKHKDILQFHHLKDKNFTIGHVGKISWNKLIKEIDKCILLCPTCHRKAHTYKHQSQTYQAHKICIRCKHEFTLTQDNIKLFNGRKHCVKCVPKIKNSKMLKCKSCGLHFEFVVGEYNSCKNNLCTKCYLRSRKSGGHKESVKAKCYFCGFDSIVEYHHINKKISNKCLPVCPTCHREIHAGHRLI